MQTNEPAKVTSLYKFYYRTRSKCQGDSPHRMMLPKGQRAPLSPPNGHLTPATSTENPNRTLLRRRYEPETERNALIRVGRELRMRGFSAILSAIRKGIEVRDKAVRSALSVTQPGSLFRAAIISTPGHHKMEYCYVFNSLLLRP